MRRAALFAATLLPLPLLLGISPLAGQESSASLEITVQAFEDDRPLAGAQVMIEGLGMAGLTDRSGFARISSLPHGPRAVQVHYLGFASMDEVLVFEAARPTRVVVKLGIEPIALREVRVRGRESALVRRGFYERMRFGQGTFLTREEIEAMRPRHLSDVLRRIGGVQIGAQHFGTRPTAQMRGGLGMRSCPIQYYVDGTFVALFNIDEILPDDVEGMEIYRGAATIPAEYNKGTAICGLILIWTRN